MSEQVQKSLVRVLFHSTSVKAHLDAEGLRGVMRSDHATAFKRESALAEEMMRNAIGSLFGDQCLQMDIIHLALAVRTQETLTPLVGKMIWVINEDKAQIETLVKSFSFPNGCTELRIVFLESQIDANLNFAVGELRDTDAK